MGIKISKRIQCIANCVQYSLVGDIATDHCLIGIEVSKNKNVKKIIGCDINKEPLDRGRVNIEKCKISNIELRLGDGIEPIKSGEVETLIIGGIGGELMLEILKKSHQIVDSINQLILQPQSYETEVKKYIHSIGFKIKEEIIVEEKKYYTIYNLIKGLETYTDKEYVIGRTVRKNKDYKKYIDYKIFKTKNIVNNLENAKEYLNEKNKLEKFKWLLNIYKKECENIENKRYY